MRKKSVRVQERSKSVQKPFKTVRNMLRKMKELSRSEMVWFRLFTRKSITGCKKAFGSIMGRKRAFVLGKKHRSRVVVFLQNGQKPSFLKTDWKKPIYYQVCVMVKWHGMNGLWSSHHDWYWGIFVLAITGTHVLHVWNIYLQNWVIKMGQIMGKCWDSYSSTMVRIWGTVCNVR